MKETAKNLFGYVVAIMVALSMCDDMLEYSGVIAPLHRRPADAMDLYVFVPLSLVYLVISLYYLLGCHRDREYGLRKRIARVLSRREKRIELGCYLGMFLMSSAAWLHLTEALGRIQVLQPTVYAAVHAVCSVAAAIVLNSYVFWRYQLGTASGQNRTDYDEHTEQK